MVIDRARPKVRLVSGIMLDDEQANDESRSVTTRSVRAHGS
jgi:hypothetical protein